MHLKPFAYSLRQLQYFHALAMELSFRKAAERCHVSQPSLSAQLAELEDALGVRLFERDRKAVRLTSAGRDLLVRARRVLTEADDLLDAARLSAGTVSGTLRIGVIPTISPYLLPPLTPKLKKQFEHLTVAWVEEKTSAIRQELQEGGLDAALVALEADLGDIEQEVIARDPFVLAMPPEHPLASRTTAASAHDLRDSDVLLLYDGHCFRDQALAVCSLSNAHELAFRATSLSTLVQMVAGGNGVTLLPALSAPTELRRAKLKVRAFKEPAPHRTIALIWRRRSPLAEAFRQLAAVIRDVYPKA